MLQIKIKKRTNQKYQFKHSSKQICTNYTENNIATNNMAIKYHPKKETYPYFWNN